MLLLAALTVVVASCGPAPQTILEPRGPLAESPDFLLRVVLVIALVVFLIVQGLLVYAVVRYRDRGEDTPDPEQVHGNTRLELVWTLIPALILAGIAVPTVQRVFELDEVPDDALVVEVVGHRWWGEYTYPQNGEIVTANELVIPVDTPINLQMTSRESGSPANAVLHSFWVPALAGKQDVAPGRFTQLNMEASETGEFQGQCSEYCGLSHANMRNYATVLSQEDFDAWVTQQQQPAPEPEPGSLAERGAELFAQPRANEDTGEQQACVQCHMIDGGGQSEGAIVGPNLTHLMSREMFAGSIYDLYVTEDTDGNDWGTWTDEPNVDQLRAWVENSPAEKPMRANADTGKVGMPNLEFTSDELDAIVAYLLTLQ